MAIETLQSAVEAIPERLGPEELSEGFALLDRLSARLTRAARVFELEGGPGLDAAQSLASWLRGFATRSPGDAGRVAAWARRLGELPVTSALWASGALSSAQIAIIMRTVTLPRLALFASHEATLSPNLVGADLQATEAAMARWASIADATLGDGERPEEPPRSLQLAETLEGRHEGRLSLDSLGGATLNAALNLFERPNDEGETRLRSHRRGDALVELCAWALQHHDRPPCSRRERPHVNVTVDLAETIAGRGGHVVGGGPIDGATIRALLCDANVHRLITDGPSVILDYGRATRTITPALWTALVIRDRHCTFEGCDTPAERCEAHHVRHWLDGGTTDLTNLRLRCWHHHHLAHQPGWHDKLLPDGTVETTSPTGRVFHSKPPGA